MLKAERDEIASVAARLLREATFSSETLKVSAASLGSGLAKLVFRRCKTSWPACMLLPSTRLWLSFSSPCQYAFFRSLCFCHLM